MTTNLEPLADSVTVAAKRLGISRSALYLELKAGRLRGLKAGRRTIISRAAQVDWLAALPASHATATDA